MRRPVEACCTLESTDKEWMFKPVDRARLASYLELPSLAELDDTTDAEIRKLDARRQELLSFWKRAIAVPIERIDGKWIELESGAPVEATAAYGRHLLKSGADWLILATFTIGEKVDEAVKVHLANDELFEAFVLKQWSATMAEQARAWLTHALCAWADRQGRSLMPYSGPGYNSWPLNGMGDLLERLYAAGNPEATLPIRAIDSGMLLPVNSMLIVYGATPLRADITRDESLAQCHRCAMSNCNYRIAPLDKRRKLEVNGVTR